MCFDQFTLDLVLGLYSNLTELYCMQLGMFISGFNIILSKVQPVHENRVIHDGKQISAKQKSLVYLINPGSLLCDISDIKF